MMPNPTLSLASEKLVSEKFVSEKLVSETGAIESLYDTDFYGWTQEQAQVLSSRDWNRLDIEHLVEEVESLGKQQRQELRSRLSIVLGHLLKWEFQPECRSRSWLATLRIQRRDITRLLKDNPSLKPYLEHAIEDAYDNGRDLAIAETDLPGSRFPVECPYEFDVALDAMFYPGEPSELIED